MLRRLRRLAARVWPVLRLRWLLFGALLFAAALPGLAVLALRETEHGQWSLALLIVLGSGAIFGLLLLVAGLSAATRALAQGRTARLRAPTLEVREIRSLNTDFAAMAEAINRRSRYLRDFAASLSHEFKTPLAGICGGIELLQDHGAGMSEPERAKFLSNMEGDAQRLSRLVSRLMELAQADMARAESGARGNLAAVTRIPPRDVQSLRPSLTNFRRSPSKKRRSKPCSLR
jgi:signal transduction histidine kinase